MMLIDDKKLDPPGLYAFLKLLKIKHLGCLMTRINTMRPTVHAI
jgi:hypothetical protein